MDYKNSYFSFPFFDIITRIFFSSLCCYCFLLPNLMTFLLLFMFGFYMKFPSSSILPPFCPFLCVPFSITHKIIFSTLWMYVHISPATRIYGPLFYVAEKMGWKWKSWSRKILGTKITFSAVLSAAALILKYRSHFKVREILEYPSMYS